MAKITVEKAEIAVISVKDNDYISLTDIAHSQMEEHIIIKWLSLKSTIEYIGEWEALYNPRFNYTEFGTIKNEAGSNNFVLSVKQWIEKTGAIGIAAKAGRYGGTYAHKDIAFHFGMWISPRFQLLLVKEFQRLKEAEQKLIGWSAKRELAKINYHIHTDAIKENLIPKELTSKQASIVCPARTPAWTALPPVLIAAPPAVAARFAMAALATAVPRRVEELPHRKLRRPVQDRYRYLGAVLGYHPAQ
jgi:hypothetical protein